MPRSRRNRTLVAGLVGLSLVAAACGGDDGGDSASDTTSAEGNIDRGRRRRADRPRHVRRRPARAHRPGAQLDPRRVPGHQLAVRRAHRLRLHRQGEPGSKGLVAEKWEPNADATEFTFTIKPGLTFTNGDPVLPSSFKYAWVRNGQADFARPTATSSSTSRAAPELQDGTVDNLDDSIKADDTAMTLTVTLEAPEADFPAIAGSTRSSAAARRRSVDAQRPDPVGQGHHDRQRARSSRRRPRPTRRSSWSATPTGPAA